MKTKTAKIILIILLAIILLLGLAFVIFSYLPFGMVKQFTGTVFKDWSEDYFRIGLQLRLRFVGIMVLLFGGIFGFEIKRIGIFFENIFKKLAWWIKNENKLHFYILLGIFISGIILRLIFININIRYSEAFTFLNYKARPFFSGLIDYTSTSNHVLNTFMTTISYIVFGQKEWALRIPALLSGILLIPVIYIFGRIFYNKNTGIIAAAIAAASPALINFSVLSGGFMTIVLFSLALLCLAKYLKDHYDPIVWLIFAIISALGFITGPIFIFPFMMTIIWLILVIIFKDTALLRKNLFKEVLIYLCVAAVLTFAFFIPLFITRGLQNIVNMNFIKYDSYHETAGIFISSLKSGWNIWNVGIHPIFQVLFSVFILVAIIFGYRITKDKTPVVLAALITFIPLLLLKRAVGYGEVWLFLLPVLITFCAAGISFLLSLIFKKAKTAKHYLAPVVSVLIVAAITVPLFILQPIEKFNKKETIKDMETITQDLKTVLTDGDKIVAVNPADIILDYYLLKYKIPQDYLRSYFFPTNKLYIILDKNTGQETGNILKNYFGSEKLEKFGINDLRVLKDYDSVSVYIADSLIPEKEPVLDYNSFAEAEFENTGLSDDKKEIIIEEGRADLLKTFKIPLIIESGKDYLISFEIKKTDDLNNALYFDFFGEGYDNSDQEFVLEPVEVHNEFLQIRYVLNSGQIPDNTETFFRMYTYSIGETQIRNLEIFEVDRSDI
ncbi:MAG: glycosyltransferase family 39 protein [Actinobacteria bacterium]|nr:glycosyltransferase family 39 protein [Actinomycetota bacterium]